MPNDSLLSPSPATAQQADIRNGNVKLTLPSTGNQDDSWSCGPNSAARVLAFYGHRVNYEQVRSVSQREKGIIPPRICIGSGILKKCFDSSGFKTGFEPWELRDVMNRWEGGNAKYESGSDLGKLKSLLSQGKPVLVLRRVGSFKPGIVFGTWPEMHWVAVRGYNDKVQGGKIYFTDTNGADVEKSYDKFMSEWDWRIGDGLASETFKQKGVKPKTMVWVDRTPPSLTSSALLYLWV
nr:C39 family peptidase [Trichocoleus sp. FACHB-90]